MGGKMKPFYFAKENADMMIRGILEGRKSTMRLPVKAAVLRNVCPPDSVSFEGGVATFAWNGPKTIGGFTIKPPYQPGDILYIREAWSVCDNLWDGTDMIIYRASCNDGQKSSIKWLSFVRMPKEAARIFLRVTEVRMERLQSGFTEPICPIFELQSEGVDIGETCQGCIENYGEPCCVDTVDEDGTGISECVILDDVRADFSDLWDSTIRPADHALYGWSADPWVWVIRFKRISREEAHCG